MTDDLFLGLVTHPKSRFGEAAGVSGLVRAVAESVRASGRTATVFVSDRDDWTPDLVPLDRATVRASVDAELALEERWHEYLLGRPLPARQRAGLVASHLRRVFRYCPPWRRDLDGDDPGPRMVRRLVNIELSHLRVMRAAVDSGARWALLVEDDAAVSDPGDFATGLLAFLDFVAASDQPQMVNLSDSFSPHELGIEPLLSSVSPIVDVPWSLHRSSRLVTNTVCAVLYRRDFLIRVAEAIEGIPVEPVVPIDFKLNAALLSIAPTTTEGDCWFAWPAPIAQLSGVPEVRR